MACCNVGLLCCNTRQDNICNSPKSTRRLAKRFLVSANRIRENRIEMDRVSLSDRILCVTGVFVIES